MQTTKRILTLTCTFLSAPLLTLGCAPPDPSDAALQSSEAAALSSVNGLSSINGLSSVNGLSSLNGLSTTNGLSSINGLASLNGLMTSDGGRKTVSYIARCALPAGDSLVKADQNHVSHTFPGQLGLAPQWKTGACDTNCQQIMSACLMAHINTTGKNVALWLDSPVHLGLGRSPAHPIQESAFFGNIFVSPPQAFFCNGNDWDRGPAAGRIGANQSGSPYRNPFGNNALCKNLCSIVGYNSEAYGSCGGFSNVITVFRDFDTSLPYYICNTTTNMCLDVKGKSTADGGIIDLYPFNGGSNQKFFIERRSTASDSGTYRIRSASSNKYLDITGGSTAAGAGLIQWRANDGLNQEWNLVQVVAGTYLIENVRSHLLLNAAGLSAGGQVKQSGSGSYGSTQMWKATLAQ